MFCAEGYGTIRIFRLFRILKLLRYWKQLQDILRGLIGGLKASSSILLLFAFVFFLFGTIGVIQFGRNDPFHFGTLPRAIVTLFRLSTLEWASALYINYYGCTGAQEEQDSLKTIEGTKIPIITFKMINRSGAGDAADFSVSARRSAGYGPPADSAAVAPAALTLVEYTALRVILRERTSAGV